MDTTIKVKMLNSVGEYKQNESYEIDADTANKWLVANLCEKAQSTNEDNLDNIASAIEDRVVSKITTAIRAQTEVKLPATVRDDSDRSFGDWITNVGRAGNPRNHLAQEKARNTLANKYGSSHNKTETPLIQAGGAANYDGVNATPYGAYLVPPEFQTSLLYAEGYQPFWQNATVIPMKSNVEYFPVLDQTVTPSAGSSAFAGGAVVAVTSEGNVPSNTTQPQFKQLALSTLKLLAYSEVSNEMLDNSSPAVAPIVENAVRVAINSFIDSDVIFGAGGTSALTGLMDNAATKQISRAGSSTVTAPDIFGMYAGLLPSSRNTAMWICFPTVLPQLFAIGSAYQYIFLQNNITGKPAMSLLGLPLVTHEAMATLGLSGDIMLIDMKQYLIGINKQLAFDASPHVKFTSDITTFRASIRVAGKPKFSAQFILMDGSSTVSPYIQLDRYGSAS